jgi:predicted transcriptional regulator
MPYYSLRFRNTTKIRNLLEAVPLVTHPEIARRLKLSISTVSRVAKELGITRKAGRPRKVVTHE